MATIRKKHTQQGYHYVIDFTFRDKRHVITTKTSDRRLAKQILHDIEGKIARGTFKLEEYQEKHVHLQEFKEAYFKFAESYKRPATIELEHFVINAFIGALGNRDLRQIDNEVLDFWKSQRLTLVNPSTFNLELRTLKAFLNVAVRWGYLEKNPLNQVAKLKVEEKRLYMTDLELKKFFDALLARRDTSRGKVYPAKLLLSLYFYEFMLNTGLRREEGTSLQISDVNLDLGVIHIRKTKDKDSRDVPLSKRAREILEMVGDGLFASLSKAYVTHTFTATCKDAGLKGFKLHSLRHTFATRLIDLGVDVLTVSKILGHSDISTTMIYAKVQRQTMQKAVDRLEKCDSYVTIRLLRGDEGE
jgi:integrase